MKKIGSEEKKGRRKNKEDEKIDKRREEKKVIVNILKLLQFFISIWYNYTVVEKEQKEG